MIDTDKYEGLIDAEGYIDYDGLDHLLAEVKRLREELQKVCSHTDYSMTMIGAVCNICGLEEGGEE